MLQQMTTVSIKQVLLFLFKYDYFYVIVSFISMVGLQKYQFYSDSLYKLLCFQSILIGNYNKF